MISTFLPLSVINTPVSRHTLKAEFFRKSDSLLFIYINIFLIIFMRTISIISIKHEVVGYLSFFSLSSSSMRVLATVTPHVLFHEGINKTTKRDQSYSFLPRFSTQTQQSDKPQNTPKKLAAASQVPQKKNELSESLPKLSCQGQQNSFFAYYLCTVISALPTAEASLVVGVVFGGLLPLPTQLYQALKVTGMLHVVSASGANVGLVSASVTPLVAKWSLKWRWLLLQASIVGYGFLAGWPVSIKRAVIMASCGLLAKLLGRQYSASRALWFSGAVLIAYSPDVLSDMGFQLSFLATLGLIKVLPLFQTEESVWQKILLGSPDSLSKPPRWRQEMVAGFTTTLAAQSFIWPWWSYQLGEVNLWVLVTSTALSWLTEVMTLTSAALLLLGAVVMAVAALPGMSNIWWVFSFLSELLLWPVRLFLYASLWFGQSTWGVWQGVSIPWWGVALCWALLWWRTDSRWQKAPT
jgi:ComEC/Rec2-related protein